jgi:hypothetical protein
MEKYPQNQDNSIVPSAVFLARSDKCKEEREYLESLVSQAPGKNQKDWIARISSEDEIIHFSSWFEIMLYGWLKQRGDVKIEPEIDGKLPDFSMDLLGRKVFFEAKVRMDTIYSSKKVNTHNFNGLLPRAFTKFGDPYELKSMLEEKIQQHKGIFKSGYAYIICIYLRSIWNDQSQVKEAIFGRDFSDAVDIGRDDSGLFAEKEELSKIVTGFLIFESYPDSEEKRRVLKVHYINNPYAEVQIDPNIVSLLL